MSQPPDHREATADHRRAVIRCLLVVVGAALYWVPFLRIFQPVGDEGIILCGAQRVAEGAVPSRDFVDLMGPGSFYWLGLFFKLFGASWIVSRAVLLFTMIAITVLLYWLARRLASGGELLISLMVVMVMFPTWAVASHHWDSNLYALAAFACFLLWQERRRPYLAAAAGALAGVVSVIMQIKGALLLAAFVAAVWLLERKFRRSWRPILLLAGSYAAVGLIVVAAYFAAGALPDLIDANVRWPAGHYRSVNSVPYGFGLWHACRALRAAVLTPLLGAGISSPLASFLTLPELVIAGLPFVLALIAAFHRRSAFRAPYLPYWTAGIALWLAEIHRSDYVHLIFGCPILLTLCLALVRRELDRRWSYAFRVVAAATVLVGALNSLIVRGADVRLDTRRGPVYAGVDDEALRFLQREVAPGADLFVYPYNPTYYFLSGARNPTRFSNLMYQINTEGQFRESVAALESRKVKYVLWDRVVDAENLRYWFPSYHHPPADQQIMEPYLTSHYDLVSVKSGFRILRRKEAD